MHKISFIYTYTYMNSIYLYPYPKIKKYNLLLPYKPSKSIIFKSTFETSHLTLNMLIKFNVDK